MLHTAKSSLSKIQVQSYRAAFNCIRYFSFSGDKNSNWGVNEGFPFVKQYFILKVYQPITLSHKFQNYGEIRLLWASNEPSRSCQKGILSVYRY
jgi:hypothetical protein